MRNETALKYIPTDFLYASSLDGLALLLDPIHEYLKSLFNGSYTQARKALFLEMLTQDFSNKICELLSSMKVLNLPFESFEKETETGARVRCWLTDP